MRKTSFVNNCFYHVYNRGVDKRDIFLDSGDYTRLIHHLFVLNDENPCTNFSRSFNRFSHNERGETSFIMSKSRKMLVKIHCFCFMPNHFHLILEQLVDGGITKFMQKLGTAYTMFFNAKYERSGVLFQGSFKTILIENDEYFLHLTRYIHLNPVELLNIDWENTDIKDWTRVSRFLEKYRWSSYLDYFGKNNFPSVTSRNFLEGLFNNRESHKKFINEYLSDDLARIKNETFE